MALDWQTPLSDVIPLTRSFEGGTPGGTNALGLECQGVSASDNCLGFRQLVIGGTLTGVVVAPPTATPVPTAHCGYWASWQDCCL
jgi:hypothetical protein